MKDFFKFMFATVAGIILSSVVFFIIGIVTLFGMVSASETETTVRKNSIVMLDLEGALLERSQDNPFEQFWGSDYTTYGLDDVLASIQKAKENENIKGIYIQAGYLAASTADLLEIRNALADFKESGKFIVAYGDQYTQGLYYLSSVADKVLLNPKGMVEWRGMASTPVFYKDLLGKLGIDMQIFKVGTYKSAVEPFIATEMSDANREQITQYIGDIWGEILADVSKSRNLTVDSLNAYADRMLMMLPADETLKCGLVDTLIYRNDVRSYLKKMANLKEDDRMPVLGLNDMVNVKKSVPKDKSGNIIAVYYAFGDIDMPGTSSEEGIISSDVIRDLRDLKDDDDVKAVVLRVNSPGGSAYGSEQIWKAIEDMKAKKPVIVSMGSYAASGGYYISCNADTIVAEPTTLTGSIGVFGMIPNTAGLMNKIGVSFDVVKTNKYSDFGTITRALNNDEQGLLQQMVNDQYEIFVGRCAEGRGMTVEEIKKIAEGRVWTGVRAKELGLVDVLGGLDTALEIAIQKADVTGYSVVSYPAKKTFFENLFSTDQGNYIKSRMIQSELGEFGEYYKDLSNLKNMNKETMIQARLPFYLNMK